ncbi:MAG TPA: sigma-54-dependent Fis family transcriptional regulator, partial [Candidatus Aminicenantes bacterium]|nr:sigma-54-dependent Fis family transcriptional regulator [Candidatus Aminicenantes bacterium]
MPKILIVDDEPSVRLGLRAQLEQRDWEVFEVENGGQALRITMEMDFDVILLDLRLPDMNGLEVLKEIKKITPQTPVLIITGYATIPTAVEAIKLGAENFLPKPIELSHLEVLLEKMLSLNQIRQEVDYWRKKISQRNGQSLFWEVQSRKMAESLRLVKILAQSPNLTVLISGETGTGKTEIAKLIHYLSPRRDKPFVEVNCAAITPTLLESELFGHERGAFTDAHTTKRGLFEIANDGTLFLDEIGEMPLSTQPKLLGAIENQRFRRVGGVKEINVDVRIIVASNRDLKEAMKKKEFRQDLFWRLNVMSIELPPLRERKEDIIPLAEYFLARASLSLHKKIEGFSPEVINLILSYPWPGNIRELKNVIERAILITQGKLIRIND